MAMEAFESWWASSGVAFGSRRDAKKATPTGLDCPSALLRFHLDSVASRYCSSGPGGDAVERSGREHGDPVAGAHRLGAW